MGVQYLWNILEPCKQVESIENLRGKTLCVDVSLWICEAQGTKGLKDQLRPYLRTVFFRTLYLTSLGVRPVFVIDGIPPEIKRETIIKRLQDRGYSGRSCYGAKKLKRSKFSIWCDECCEMFRLLGIPFVKSEGEAEALCAWLNKNKYVDGVLTDDGDVFLYGAKVVYKDFNISSSKCHTDCLQVYNINEIERSLGLNQRNLVALGLLLGCDYLPTGVPGVGKETAIKLLTHLSGVDLIQRFYEWKASPNKHPLTCEKLEVNIKRKAVKDANFPQEAVIKEFLSPKVGQTKIDITWGCPNLAGIKEFFLRKLEWPEEYTEEKMLNLGTDWQIALDKITMFIPVRIKKERVKQKVELFEIEWQSRDERKCWPEYFTCIKTKDVIRCKYPNIVESFENEMAAKKTATNGKKKTKKKSQKESTSTPDDGDNDIQDILAKVQNIHLEEESEDVEEVFVTKPRSDEILGASKATGDDSVEILGKYNAECSTSRVNCVTSVTNYNTSVTGFNNEKIGDGCKEDSWSFDTDLVSLDVTPNQSPVRDFTTDHDISNCGTPDNLFTCSVVERTPLNLANITIDPTFDIGSPNIEELLARSSFVESKSSSRNENVSPDTSRDEEHQSFDIHTTRRSMDEEKENLVQNTLNDTNLSQGPVRFEEESLSTRLLRRFQMRNNDIAKTLKSISS